MRSGTLEALKWIGLAAMLGDHVNKALFGDQLPLIGWAGMALIVGSGITATVLRARAAPDTPAEEH